MKVLVTGSNGFVGRNVVRVLLERGHEVIGLGRRAASLEHDRFQHVICDLGDARALESRLRPLRPDAAVHLAWYTEPGRYWSAPENLECLAHGLSLLRILASIGCRRFIGGGTCAEYDWSFEDLDERETPLRPATLYGAAKASLFLTGERFAAAQGLSFGWARYHFLFGPDEDPRRLVPSAIRALSTGTDFPCTEGRQIRDFLHIDDAANATVALLESDLEGAVDIASGTPTSLRAVVDTLSELIAGPGRPRYGEVPMRADEPGRLVPRLLRLSAELGWLPALNLRAGLLRTVNVLVPPVLRHR